MELAVGDAYGSCFEATSKEFIERNNDLHYEIHPRILKRYPADKQPTLVPSGHYTDDTQMSIAVAEMMLDDDFDWYDQELIAEKFLEVFKRDERRGYTPYFFMTLLNSYSGKELLSKLNGKSDKSGAFMRASPIGFYSDLNEVKEKAVLQAVVTHDSWVGRNSAIGSAMMVYYFRNKLGKKSDLTNWLCENHFKQTLRATQPFEAYGELVKPWTPENRVRVHGWDCFQAAVYAIEQCDSLSELLYLCVQLGGDSDTVATVAMAAASFCEEYELSIPQNLVDELEDKKFGRKFLIDLDSKLEEKFPCVTST